MFIVSLTYIKPIEEVDLLIAEHIDFLDEQYRLGNFQLSGRKQPRTGGVILATVKSREILDQILDLDPFHREKIAHYEVIEMVPSKSSKALEFLIEV